MVLMSLVKSPIALVLFCFGNITARPARCGQPICSIADTRTNRQIAPLFLTAAKPRQGTSELGESLERAARLRSATQGQDPARCGICTGYDSGEDRGPKLALSRAAQRHVFALWVLHP